VLSVSKGSIGRVRAACVRFGCVLADAGHGHSAPFRQGLSARGLVWSVGVPRTQRVFITGVGLLFPRAGRGKPRQHAVPSEQAQAGADVLAGCRWRRIVWRRGGKGALATVPEIRRAVIAHLFAPPKLPRPMSALPKTHQPVRLQTPK
jgi:hypothetical protein